MITKPLQQVGRAAYQTNITSGQPTHTVNVVGEPNRPAVIRQTMYNGSTESSEKSGDVPK